MRKRIVVVAVVVLVYNHVRCSVTVTVSQSFFAIFADELRVCFTTNSTSHSQLIMGISPLFFPSSDQVNIRRGHLLTPILNTYPHNSHMLPSILSRVVSLFSTSYFGFSCSSFQKIHNNHEYNISNNKLPSITMRYGCQ
jgi:hypothetical protein